MSWRPSVPMDTQLTEPAPSQPSAPAPAGAEARRLPMTVHLDELRKRLWVCVGMVAVTSMVSFVWAEWVIDWLKRPAGAALPRLAFFSPPEAVLAYMKVAVTAGLILSMPVVLYELWAFIRPGLTPREQRYGCGFVWWGSVLFLAGGGFAYWALLPVSLQFLLGFGGGQLEPVISISRYLSFTTMILLACGLVFQLPLVVFLLARLGLIQRDTLRRQWRQAVLVMMVASAMLTPTTDVATMLLLVIPMLALYEVSTWIAAVAARRRHEA